MKGLSMTQDVYPNGDRSLHIIDFLNFDGGEAFRLVDVTSSAENKVLECKTGSGFEILVDGVPISIHEIEARYSELRIAGEIIDLGFDPLVSLIVLRKSGVFSVPVVATWPGSNIVLNDSSSGVTVKHNGVSAFVPSGAQKTIQMTPTKWPPRDKRPYDIRDTFTLSASVGEISFYKGASEDPLDLFYSENNIYTNSSLFISFISDDDFEPNLYFTFLDLTVYAGFDAFTWFYYKPYLDSNLSKTLWNN